MHAFRPGRHRWHALKTASSAEIVDESSAMTTERCPKRPPGCSGHLAVSGDRSAAASNVAAACLQQPALPPLHRALAAWFGQQLLQAIPVQALLAQEARDRHLVPVHA